LGDTAEAGGGRIDGGCVPRARHQAALTFYKKAKFGGLDVSDARQPKVLGDGHAKLKRMLANATLDNVMLKDIASETYDLRRPGKGRDCSDGGKSA
jgi:hypothetical protein